MAEPEAISSPPIKSAQDEHQQEGNLQEQQVGHLSQMDNLGQVRFFCIQLLKYPILPPVPATAGFCFSVLKNWGGKCEKCNDNICNTLQNCSFSGLSFLVLRNLFAENSKLSAGSGMYDSDSQALSNLLTSPKIKTFFQLVYAATTKSIWCLNLSPLFQYLAPRIPSPGMHLNKTNKPGSRENTKVPAKARD